MVLHSRNPMVPTFRSDVRMFQVVTSSNHGKIVTWLGGGADLTPYYLFRPDIQSFHCMYSDLCIRHDLVPGHSSFTYESMKRACDTYFYLPSRQEHRGTGGIFFDDMPVSNNSDRDEMNTTNISTGIHHRINFVKDLTQIWMPSWRPIVQQRNHLPYTDEQKYWQKLRRGRYLEFNLLYDVS
jgi:coproporphyrinogen III oxidase